MTATCMKCGWIIIDAGKLPHCPRCGAFSWSALGGVGHDQASANADYERKLAALRIEAAKQLPPDSVLDWPAPPPVSSQSGRIDAEHPLVLGSPNGGRLLIERVFLDRGIRLTILGGNEVVLKDADVERLLSVLVHECPRLGLVLARRVEPNK